MAPPAPAQASARGVARQATPQTRAQVREVPPEPVRRSDSGTPGALDKSTKIGLLVTGGLAVVVAIVLLVVMNKKAAERERIAAFDKEVTDLQKQLRDLDSDNEAEATRLLEVAKTKEPLWKQHALAADIQTLVGRTLTNLESGQERRGVMAQLEQLEARLKSPEALSAEDLKLVRRGLDDIEPKIGLGGAELLARFALARVNGDKTYATRLFEEARRFSEGNRENPRLALVRHQTAEDEIKNLLDRAYREKVQELQDFYTPLYKQAIAECDRLATEVFTTEASEKLPWIDCLAGQQATYWNASDAKGFSHRVDGGVLQIIGPDADAGRIAVISIGDREQWRNFVADLEFTVEQGGFDIYFRLGRSPNANTLAYFIRTQGENANAVPGKPCRVRAAVLGSRFTFRFQDDSLDAPKPVDETASWTMSRKGAIGLLVPPGARMKFTRFQVRELR